MSSSVQGQRDGTAWHAEVEAAQAALLPTPQSAAEWAEVAWMVAVRLDVLGTLDGRLGVLSLLAMLDAGELDVLPDRATVLALEESLIEHTIATATVSPEPGNKEDNEVASIHKARKRLGEDFQLAPSEVASLLALAQQRSVEAMPSGVALRSMQLLGRDDLARRAANSLDRSSEIAAPRLFA